jgi:hypothetical protein
MLTCLQQSSTMMMSGEGFFCPWQTLQRARSAPGLLLLLQLACPAAVSSGLSCLPPKAALQYHLRRLRMSTYYAAGPEPNTDATLTISEGCIPARQQVHPLGTTRAEGSFRTPIDVTLDNLKRPIRLKDGTERSFPASLQAAVRDAEGMYVCNSVDVYCNMLMSNVAVLTMLLNTFTTLCYGRVC